MLVHLLETDSPLVALMPFLSLPYLLKKSHRYHSSFTPDVTPKTTQQKCTQSSQAQCQYEGDTR